MMCCCGLLCVSLLALLFWQSDGAAACRAGTDICDVVAPMCRHWHMCCARADMLVMTRWWSWCDGSRKRGRQSQKRVASSKSCARRSRGRVCSDTGAQLHSERLALHAGLLLGKYGTGLQRRGKPENPKSSSHPLSFFE